MADDNGLKRVKEEPRGFQKVSSSPLEDAGMLAIDYNKLYGDLYRKLINTPVSEIFPQISTSPATTAATPGTPTNTVVSPTMMPTMFHPAFPAFGAFPTNGHMSSAVLGTLPTIMSADMLKKEPRSEQTDGQTDAFLLDQSHTHIRDALDLIYARESKKIEEMDLEKLVDMFRDTLEKFGVSQRFAARFIMQDTSQGNLSFLMEKGKNRKWEELSPRGRVPYLRMKAWLESAEQQQFTLNMLKQSQDQKRASPRESYSRRERFSMFQIHVLCRLFEENPNPPMNIRNAVGERLNIPLDRVNVWFQNQRARGFPARKFLDQTISDYSTIAPASSPAQSSRKHSGRRRSEEACHDIINGDYGTVPLVKTSAQSSGKQSGRRQSGDACQDTINGDYSTLARRIPVQSSGKQSGRRTSGQACQDTINEDYNTLAGRIPAQSSGKHTGRRRSGDACQDISNENMQSYDFDVNSFHRGIPKDTSGISAQDRTKKFTTPPGVDWSLMSPSNGMVQPLDFSTPKSHVRPMCSSLSSSATSGGASVPTSSIGALSEIVENVNTVRKLQEDIKVSTIQSAPNIDLNRRHDSGEKAASGAAKRKRGMKPQQIIYRTDVEKVNFETGSVKLTTNVDNMGQEDIYSASSKRLKLDSSLESATTDTETSVIRRNDSADKHCSSVKNTAQQNEFSPTCTDKNAILSGNRVVNAICEREENERDRGEINAMNLSQEPRRSAEGGTILSAEETIALVQTMYKKRLLHKPVNDSITEPDLD